MEERRNTIESIAVRHVDKLFVRLPHITDKTLRYKKSSLSTAKKDVMMSMHEEASMHCHCTQEDHLACNVCHRFRGRCSI